jgi:tRNA 2-thiocytidine biosynthesis protein TtcA
MNLFFAGKLQAMPASYRTDDDRFDVIRPLVECPEPLIAEYAALSGFPILPCNLCGSQPNLERDAMSRMLQSLEERHPNVRSVMAAALGNVVPTHLLDPELLTAWKQRGPAVAPKTQLRTTQRHASAEAVRSEPRRLPVVTRDAWPGAQSQE